MTDPGLDPDDRTRLASLPIEERIAAIREDQSCRWRAGRPLPAEVYLDAFDDIAGDDDAALVVIGGELALRLETDEDVDAAEFGERFPRFRNDIPLLLEVQRTIAHEVSLVADVGRPVVPGYDLEDELGRGSSGVVYRARQRRLNRPAAIKLLLAGSSAGEAALSRFEAEAQMLARLNHPNIVGVFEVGEALVAGGVAVPYIALELIEGPSLASWAGGRPVEVGVAAVITERLASAMGAAHQAGVVHRDLKPANILLRIDGNTPEPMVTDFGVAKLAGGTAATMSGAILGTPAYMAPEQARGDAARVGPAADVFALGGILYELLVGVQAFRGASAVEVIHHVVSAEPVSPGRLRAGVPRDLETVCLKCLEKDPRRRYVDAAALAADLRRYLDKQPVLARPVGFGGRLWRWSRRYPMVASLTAVVAALLVVVAVGSTLSARRLKGSLDETMLARRKANEQLLDATIAQADANRRTGRSGQRYETISLLQRAAGLADELGLRDRDDSIRNLALTAFALPDLHAVRSAAGMDPGRGLVLKPDSVETVVRRIADDGVVARLPTGATMTTFLSPNGRYVAARPMDRRLQVWDLEAVPPRAVIDVPAEGQIFAPAGDLLVATGPDGTLSVFELPNGRLRSRFPPAGLTREVLLRLHPSEPWAVTFSYFHNRLLVRSLVDGATLVDLTLPSGVTSADWSGDGRWLAVAGSDEVVRIYRTDTWRIQNELAGCDGGARVVFDPTGEFLVGSSWAPRMKLWRRHGLRPLLEIPGVHGVGPSNFDADRETFASSLVDYETGHWRCAPGRERQRLIPSRRVPHEDAREVAIHPAGRLMAVGSTRGLRLWDLATGAELAHLATDRYVRGPVFTDDGTLLVRDPAGVWGIRFDSVAGSPGRLKAGRPERISESPANSLAGSRDGGVFAWGCRTVSASQPYAGAWVHRRDGPARGIRLVAGTDPFVDVSPDGRWVTYCDLLGQMCYVVSASDGRGNVPLAVNSASPATFSRDGSILALGGKRIQMMQVAGKPDTWAPGASIASSAQMFAFDNESGVLFDATPEGSVRWFDIADGGEIARFDLPEEIVAVQLTPDRSRLILLHPDGSVSMCLLAEWTAAVRKAGLDRGRRPLPEFPRSTIASGDAPLQIDGLTDWPHCPAVYDAVECLSHLTLGDPPSLRRAARVLDRMRQHDACRLLIAAAARGTPDDPEAAYHHALAAIEARQWDAARAALALAAGDDQLHDIAILLTVAVLHVEGRDDADAGLSRLRASIEPLARTYCFEGFSYFDRGQWGPATICFAEALRRNPADPIALRFAALTRLTAAGPWRDPALALELARRAVAADRSKTIAGVAEAVALVRLGRAGEAVPIFARLAEVGEDSFIGLVRLGQVHALVTVGDRPGAEQSWQAYEAWQRDNRPGERETLAFVERLQKELERDARAALSARP